MSVMATIYQQLSLPDVANLSPFIDLLYIQS